ncbi:MAG TPA: hypothetical protein VKB36_13020, partial [Vicinamibacterales bacterium]|nr:hypothetical protein [Vicinamibacterales bacterium]
YWEPLVFHLPPPPGGRPWKRCIDTSAECPNDIRSLDDALDVDRARYHVQPRSIVFLVSRLEPGPTPTSDASENT